MCCSAGLGTKALQDIGTHQALGWNNSSNLCFVQHICIKDGSVANSCAHAVLLLKLVKQQLKAA